MENPPIVSADVPRTGGRDFVSWALNPKFAVEVKEYREIAKSIIREGGLTEQEVMDFEERFFHGGIRRQQEKVARNTKSWSKKLGKVAMFQVPKPVRILAKRLLPNRLLKFTGWQGFTLDAMCKSLSERGTHFERTELERVAELALKLDANLRQA
jgi:hypothetical protein